MAGEGQVLYNPELSETLDRVDAALEASQPNEQPEVVVQNNEQPIVNNEPAAEVVVNEAPDIVKDPTPTTPVEQPAAVVVETPTVNFEEVPDLLKVPALNTPTTPAVDDKFKEFIPFLERPEVLAVIEGLKKGQSVFETIDQVRGNDPNKMSDEQLLEIELSAHNLTDEQKDIEREAFKAMRPLEQKKLVEPVRDHLVNEQRRKMELFVKNAQSENQAAQAEAQRQAAEHAMAIQKVGEVLVAESNSIAKSLVGQKVWELEITPDRSAKLLDYVMENAIINEETKNLDVPLQEVFKKGIKELFHEEILKVNLAKKESEATLKVVTSTLRPSTDHQSAPEGKLSEEEARKSDIASLSEELKTRFDLAI